MASARESLSPPPNLSQVQRPCAEHEVPEDPTLHPHSTHEPVSESSYANLEHLPHIGPVTILGHEHLCGKLIISTQ